MPAYTTAVTSAAVNVATHFTPNGICLLYTSDAADE